MRMIFAKTMQRLFATKYVDTMLCYIKYAYHNIQECTERRKLPLRRCAPPTEANKMHRQVK